jgi:hypothetical protein
VAVFLVAISRFYHPGTGFTALIGFPEGHEYEAPAMRGIPHFDYPAWASYDGQFYAQRAFDPLARDPAVDRAMDLAPFRARRILFSWTPSGPAGRRGFLRRTQNVAAWLIRRSAGAVDAARHATRSRDVEPSLVAGPLWSVRFALLDGPSLVPLTTAVTLAETGRPLPRQPSRASTA